MRGLLRLIGVFEVLSGAVAALLAVHLLGTGTHQAAFARSVILLILGLAVVLLAAGVWLCRLRNIGRLLSLGVLSALALLTLYLMAAERQQFHQVIRLVIELVVVAILASPGARRATAA